MLSLLFVCSFPLSGMRTVNRTHIQSEDAQLRKVEGHTGNGCGNEDAPVGDHRALVVSLELTFDNVRRLPFEPLEGVREKVGQRPTNMRSQFCLSPRTCEHDAE